MLIITEATPGSTNQNEDIIHKSAPQTRCDPEVFVSTKTTGHALIIELVLGFFLCVFKVASVFYSFYFMILAESSDERTSAFYEMWHSK